MKLRYFTDLPHSAAAADEADRLGRISSTSNFVTKFPEAEGSLPSWLNQVSQAWATFADRLVMQAKTSSAF